MRSIAIMECARSVMFLFLSQVLLLALLNITSTNALPPAWDFPAIYNFGDWNLDTGGISASFEPIQAPYGESFFRGLAGRFSDGRLLIDFMEKIKLRRPREFSKSLYTIDIGQTDIVAGFHQTSNIQLRTAIPDIINQFSAAVTRLYQLGVRAFWMHNMGPIGCLPTATFDLRNPKPGVLDKYGCLKSHNEVALEFNRQLKSRIRTLRADLGHAAITYVDVYAAKYELISNAKSEDFMVLQKICCGLHEGNTHVWCGQRGIVRGAEVFGGACANP
ncbi:GDSL esterase/lipase [Capsicum galapagoense]